VHQHLYTRGVAVDGQNNLSLCGREMYGGDVHTSGRALLTRPFWYGTDYGDAALRGGRGRRGQ
jgi:hypothetical protein